MQIDQLINTVKQLPYFTKQNLGLALEKEGEDLNYWIKKLTKEKLITPLKKGFYISSYYQDATVGNPEQSELYWVYLANALRSPSYVSLEYVLSKYNIIPESAFALTSITLKSSRVYTSEKATFIYRNIKRQLYDGYQFLVFGNTGLTVRMAYPYKALFDFLYLKKFASEENMREYVLKEGRINWDVLNKQSKADFFKLAAKSDSPKMGKIAVWLKKDRKL
jgi:hypothetical protein